MSEIDYEHDNADLGLRSAILIYGTGGYHNDANMLATFHDIENRVIQPGRPLDNATVEYLFKNSGRQSSGFIPPEVIEMGPGSMTWFAKPRVNPIFFRTSERGQDKKLNKYNAVHVRWPSLVFYASGSSLACYAVKTSSRPTSKTRLYKAPFFNMFAGGAVCLPGGVKIDEALQDSVTVAVSRIEDIFYSSAFSHIGSNGKVVKFTGGCSAFWAKYCASQKKKPVAKFPNEILVPSEKYKRLGGLVK